MLTSEAAIAANRFGLGARPDDARVIWARRSGLAAGAARARARPRPAEPTGIPARVLGGSSRTARRTAGRRAGAREPRALT